MKKFLGAFRQFAMRGNVIDLAIGIIIGGAFGKIVSSLVNDVLMPVIGLISGGINLSYLAFRVGEAEVRYGAFLQASVDFLIVAFSVFLLVKGLNALRKEEPKPAVEKPATRECPYCCREIPAKAIRCPYCTSSLS